MRGKFFSPGAKQPVCKAAHPHPSTVRIKNVWSYTFTPPYKLKDLCVIKQRENFTLNI
jgi:hypothetical protein